MNKKDARTRRARQTRLRIAEQRATRLVVSRSNCHIYAQIVAPEGDRVLASASTLDKDLRGGSTGNVEAATAVGKLIAERAIAKGVKKVVFDRGGYLYHGRVKAVAEAAREAGLEF